MSESELKRVVKYEKDLKHDFYLEVASMDWGEKLLTCIQCGNCSGSCPLALYMDYGPRKIIAMTRAGFRNEVLTSNTIWLCASCYKCAVECPKEIKITDMLYGLKQIALKEHLHPRKFPTAILTREFFKMVASHGRQSEGMLIMNLYLNTNPFGALSQAVMGIKLFLQGRIGIKVESIPMGTGKKGDLKKIMDSLD
jgi:quinone-modifying oxidoreductase, subunit QmoC